MFPQPGMLSAGDLATVRGLLAAGAPRRALHAAAAEVQARMNPHPAKQQEMNVPVLPNGHRAQGLQHKYREMVLFFPGESQYCHSFCTYCFRWAQFVGNREQVRYFRWASGKWEDVMCLWNPRRMNRAFFSEQDFFLS